MAKNKNQLFNLAFDRAYRKLVKLADEGYLPLSKANMRRVATETAKQIRQETLSILGDDINELLQEFEVNLESRMDEWGQSTTVATGREEVFPQGCKFATSKDNTATFIIEQNPQVRTVMGGNHGFGYTKVPSGKRKGHQLAFPYIVFGIHFIDGEYANCTVSARNEPLNSLDDKLSHLYISNIYKDPDHLGLCMNPELLRGTLCQKCQTIIGGFWQTDFHGGNPHNHTVCPDPRLKNWETWQSETKKDAQFIMGIKWPPLPKEYTVKKLIEKIRNTGHVNGGYRYNPGGKKVIKIKNFFRRQGQILNQKIQAAVMGIVVDDYKPEIDPEFIPLVHADVPVVEERDNLKALNMVKNVAKRKAKEKQAVNKDEVMWGPRTRQRQNPVPVKRKKAVAVRQHPVALAAALFSEAAGQPHPVVARGQKRCPECREPKPVRLKICDCGWHFKDQRKIAMPPVIRPDAKPRGRRIAKEIEDKIKNLIGKGGALAQRAKAARPGKGKKHCEKCRAIVGAKTRNCACGFKFY